MKYALVDEQGNIKQIIQCSEKNAPLQATLPGQFITPYPRGVNPVTDLLFPDGTLQRDAKSPPEPTNRQLRKREMPSVQEQLDALWSGPTAVAEMQAKIDAIKAKYPLE